MSNRSKNGAAGLPPPPDSAMRQRTTTLRRSCEACRAVKARCVVEQLETTGQSRYCKRCMNQGIECHFENALARPKKLKYSARTRVKDVEEKLDGLIALISSRNDPSSGTGTPPSSSGPVPGTSASAIAAAAPTNNDFYSDPLDLSGIAYPAPIGMDLNFDEIPYLDGPGGSLAPSAGHSLSSSSYGDVIDRGLVQEELASILLAEFTLYSEKQFPFVAMPSYASLSYMRRERPFVLLAILTVAADTPIQSRLALEYRKAFAQAMLVESRSSLDMLQSVLIFCIWHHQYFRPYSSQLYQLSQIAVTMAVEINLPSTLSPTLTSLRAPYQHPLNQRARSSRTPTEQMANEIERARTFLGTYCLSASIATAHRKPTHFKYDRRMDQACQFLANAQEIPSDVHLLPYHVRIRKLSEDVDRVFGNLDHGGIALDARYIETMVKDFERQYDQLRLSMTPQSWTNAALKCAMMYLPVVIYEVALRIPPEHQELLEASPSAQCCNWCGSPTRLAILMKCISAAQDYITCYLDLPEDDARHVTIVEVSRHVDAVLILTRAGLGFDTKIFQYGVMALGRAELLKAADVARYLEASMRKMASLVTMTGIMDGGPGQEEKHDLFWQMKQIFDISLAWYNKHANGEGEPGELGEQPEKIDDRHNHHHTIDPHESAKLNVSPILWISEGTTMTRAKCAEDGAAPKTLENTPHFATGDVDSMLRALSVCVASGPPPKQHPTTNSGTAMHAATVPGSILTSAPMTTSVSASVSVPPMDAPDNSGYMSALDPRFGVSLDPSSEVVPSWSADQTASLFNNIPQSTTASPWFSL